MDTSRRLPRHLHPGSWWVWALGLATAASRTTNPLVLLLVIVVAGYVVVARRSDAPWAKAYGAFLRLGLVVLAIRVLAQMVFGAQAPGRVLVTLPSVALPEWAAGVRVGGEVTAEGLSGALYEGLRLAALLCCVGAANALASPSRLLRILPAALYEAGVAVTVAMSFAPQAVISVSRHRAARRLRGRPTRGLRAMRGVGIPVLEGALERSVELAAAMDSRGYGRRANIAPTRRRLTAAMTTGGLLGVCVGLYGLLDGGSPASLGLPALSVGTVLAVGGLVLGGRRTPRTRYRPDPWAGPEWLVAGSGIAAAALLLVVATVDPVALQPSTSPLLMPELPLAAVVAVLLGLLPAWAAPAAPRVSVPPVRPSVTDAPVRRPREPARTGPAGVPSP